jgi:hypothetical protein
MSPERLQHRQEQIIALLLVREAHQVQMMELPPRSAVLRCSLQILVKAEVAPGMIRVKADRQEAVLSLEPLPESRLPAAKMEATETIRVAELVAMPETPQEQAVPAARVAGMALQVLPRAAAAAVQVLMGTAVLAQMGGWSFHTLLLRSWNGIHPQAVGALYILVIHSILSVTRMCLVPILS